MPKRPKPGPAFTIDFRNPLPAERDGDAWWMEVDGRELRLSNLDKVFWPKERYTKGDLLAYYFNVAPLILPHLAGRPLTMNRMPDGIDGKSFYEKSAPSHVPDWIPRCPVESEDSRKGVIDYLTVGDTAGLLFVANLGCIEFHPLHSRCASVGLPDYLFFDLDPFPPITFDDVLAVARHVKVMLDRLGVVGYPKTSGATGVQIFVPVEQGTTYEQARALVREAGRLIAKADPDRVTMAWKIADRSGKVFIDHNMNREGANIAAAYSLRPEPAAPVSTPLTWREVGRGGFVPQDFRIENVWKRFAKVGDLFEGVRAEPQDVRAAMEALGLEEGGPAPVPGRRAGPAPRTSKEVIDASRDPELADYLGKRDFAGTPEPKPSAKRKQAGDSFVIHKHRATRLHYDLRLERDGALPSWAVPRGLPIVPGDRRLAVRTEDHPLEYGSFHGTIPEGHYGAGEVRIFDDGAYEPLEWTDKKVTFRLHGRRYPGLEYHLVRTRTDWLVFLATRQEAPLVAATPTLQPMLAEGGYEAFDDPKWRFEPKLDGIRSLVYLSTDSTRLVSRTGRDLTSQYPELHMLHELVNQVDAVLDGEIVAFDQEGRDSFEVLQERMNLGSQRDIERARKKIPVSLVAFDMLFLDGHDVTGLKLEDRRELLEAIVEQDPRLQLMAFADGTGTAFTDEMRKLGLEGVVAKRRGSRYQPGRRSPDWRKVKLTKTQDCVILGWTRGQGGRGKTFGSLLVGAYAGDELRWIGQVGTGFTEKMLDRVMAELRPLVRKSPPADDPELAVTKGATFVEPELVCEVEYVQMTKVGKLRAPSFKGLRQDKAPEDCLLEEAVVAQKGSKPARTSKARASRSSIPRSTRSR